MFRDLDPKAKKRKGEKKGKKLINWTARIDLSFSKFVPTFMLPYIKLSKEKKKSV